MTSRGIGIAALALILVPVFAVADDELPAPVVAALDVRQLPHDSLSIYAEDLVSGDVVLDWHGDVPRNPGSTIKLLTTLAALDLLGPTYTWQTNVYALGEVHAGRLDGNLLLEGHGDPWLVTERVWQLLRRVRAAGIREIGGDLLIDDGYFDVEAYDPGAFDRQPLRAYNVAPNALLMNFKAVRFRFEPDREAGSVRIRTEPPLANLTIDNRLSLAPGPCRGYQRGIEISANETVDRITFAGRFPARCRHYSLDRSVLGHDAFDYGLIASLWRESGGVLEGGWRHGTAPDYSEPLVEYVSLPLAEVIAKINKHSNNVMARQLLYTLSAEVLGEPGTEAGGRRVIADWLEARDLGFSKFAFDNGAGLSRTARMTARDFGALLRFAWSRPYMPEYAGSLPLSGLDGTLSRRFRESPLTGSAHLKTGSLDHVAAIAGYLQSRNGRRFAVAVLQNYTDVHRGPGDEVQEAVLRWLYEQ